ncbi:hypothetical protein EXIGUO8A_490001 [Exiguobacterium sp. 8A]|nr:hypothetical protein EXIGUO8A_490001 [Exiguobacterium sp. 8A]
MSTLTMPLDAGTVTFEILDQLQEHTPISWGGLTAAAGRSYSPLQGEAWPDYTVFPDRDDVDQVLVLDRWYDEDGQRGRTMLRLPRRTVGDALDHLHTRQPVCRFRASQEVDPFDPEGSRDPPALSVWTGPVIDAADVPATGPGPDLRGGRVVFRGRLSDRTDVLEDHPGMEAWEKLILEQTPALGEWVLRSGSHVIEDLQVHEHATELSTLDEVLTWAEQWLHTAYGSAYPMTVNSFVVSCAGAGQPMTVRVW